MSGTFRVLLPASSAASLVYSLVTLIVRHLPLTSIAALVIAVSSPYVPLVSLTCLVLSGLHRRILLSIVAAAILVATAAAQVSWYYYPRPVHIGSSTDIRVLSSNLRKGQADASSFVDLAKLGADIISASELTPEEVRRLSQAGIDDAFPYSVLIPAPGAAGIGLWSRFPLTQVPSTNQETTIVAAQVRAPGVRFDPVVVGVHVTSPLASDTDSFDAWRTGVTATKTELDGFADGAGSGAVIVAGDFNSTPDMRQFRDLLTNGYRDAVEQTGGGFAPTFPSSTWFPPLIVIDHVLTRQAAAASIRTIDVRGSDHRSLLARVKVPLDPTTS